MTAPRSGRAGPVNRRARNGPRPAFAAAGVILAVMAGACSSSGAGDITPIGANSTRPRSSADMSSSTRPAPPTTADPGGALIVERYRQAQAAFLAVAGHNPVVPTDPRIPEFMTTPLLNTIRSRLTTYALTSEHVQGTAELGPTLLSVNGIQAVVMDCGFDHTIVVDDRTGQRVGNPPDTQRTLVKATMQLGDGVWRIAMVEQMGMGCIPPAA